MNNKLLKILSFLFIVLLFVIIFTLGLIQTNTVQPPENSPQGIHKAYSTVRNSEWRTCPVSGIEYGEHQAAKINPPGLSDGDNKIVFVYKEVEPIIDQMIKDGVELTIEEAKTRWINEHKE